MAQAEALQRCIELCAQQDDIRRRMSIQISPISECPPEIASTSSARFGGFASFSSRRSPTSSSANPVPTYPGLDHQQDSSPRNSSSSNGQFASDSKSLLDINKQIKATLTELLNTDSVRQDEKLRNWVQARLMDAELEMKRERRRRSSSADRCVAESIAGSLEHTSFIRHCS